MATIFWVEDQFHWIDKFEPVLAKADFSINGATEVKDKAQGETHNQIIVHKFVESACQAINQMNSAPDIVILDANMSGNDDAGLTVASLVGKKWPDTPIIFLSEHSGTGIEEKVFDKNASQDFIAKHQENIEKVLCWRIKALLRHKKISKKENNLGSTDSLTSGNLSIDLATWNVYWFGKRLMNPSNSQRPLAPTPRKILKFLVEASPRPVSTLQMEQKLQIDRFNYASYRQHIKTLRDSFEQAANKSNQSSFLTACKLGKGIVAFGEQGAYSWIK